MAAKADAILLAEPQASADGGLAALFGTGEDARGLDGVSTLHIEKMLPTHMDVFHFV